jgi:hypothetical protein
MAASLSIHDVENINIIKAKSTIGKDLYYTDIIVTCTDGTNVRLDLFSKNELKIKEEKD